jgi:beta-lactamase class D
MKNTTKRLTLAMGLFTLMGISACSVNKADIDDSLKKYFDAKQVEGCFTMLNNSDGTITVYNLGMDTTRVLPSGTFNIANALVSLQTGIAIDENMLIKWDGVIRPNQAWNKDLSLTDAFKLASEPHFQTLARSIGMDTMKNFVDSLSYGNKNIQGSVDSFWLNNSLKISPDEQLGLMKQLYFDQLPFRASVQQAVRNMMVKEDNTLYKLSYQVGAGFDEKRNQIGWVAGWIEENRHVYFFVTLVKSPDPAVDINKVRIDISKDILKHFGFFEGRR